MRRPQPVCFIVVACGLLVVMAGRLFLYSHGFSRGRATQTVGDGFDFEHGSMAWAAQTYPGSEACKAVSISNERARDGRFSLKMSFNLAGNDAHDGCGEAWAWLDGYGPGTGKPAVQDLSGRTVTAWIYAPENSSGDAAHPNGCQLFVKDDQWHSEYGNGS